ncbi:hypothetical protein D9756_005204 [Leucocoprinus leucothites]|uniref:Endonuclease/exonuclease/phosphatase domain-containing protein n=1 Tax=Leucocoprinus leucothites TaxID=201217 RepID=A0A8H5FZZ0_9AGAR|nr:hypothetical protein D9756_005204 [Leucoagaricus leucothites]
MSGKNKPISSVRIYSQNVGRSYALVDTILKSKKLDFDIIFLQEPPWNHIRKAPSTTNPEGDDVIGAPIHPEWLCMMTTSHETHSSTRGNYIHLLNIYSDSSSSAINFLSMNFIDIPNIIYMGGDFNCQSPEWDPSATYIPMSAITLMELADGFNLTSGRQVSHAKQASGRASSTDAKLYSIRIGIAKAISLHCDHIILITDCLPAAKLAVDPSIHLSQTHSIQVCRLLSDWLTAKPSHSIDFWDVPSKWRWKPHLKVHKDVTSTCIHAPPRLGATLDFL